MSGTISQAPTDRPARRTLATLLAAAAAAVAGIAAIALLGLWDFTWVRGANGPLIAAGIGLVVGAFVSSGSRPAQMLGGALGGLLGGYMTVAHAELVAPGAGWAVQGGLFGALFAVP